MQQNPFALLLVLSCWLLLASLEVRAQQPATVTATAPALGQRIERAINSGELHHYRVTLLAGQYLAVEVEQKGIDLTVGLADVNGNILFELERFHGSQGSEPFCWISDKGGDYQLRVRTPAQIGQPGRYTLALRELRPAGPRDQQRWQAQETLLKGEQLRVTWKQVESLQAATILGEAAELYRAAGDTFGEAMSLTVKGRAYHQAGQSKEAAVWYEQAKPLFEQLGELSGAALVWWWIGELRGQTEEGFLMGRTSFQRALELCRQSDNQLLWGRILSSFGELEHDAGNKQQGFDYFQQAIARQKQTGEISGLTDNYWMMAALYWIGGDLLKAAEAYHQAIPLLRSLQRIREVAWRSMDLSLVYRQLGENQRALSISEQALEAARASGNKEVEAVAIGNRGSSYSALGEPQKALADYEAAVALLRTVGASQRIVANYLNSAGRVHTDLENPQQTLAYSGQAKGIYNSLQQLRSAADCAYVLGRAYHSLGQYPEALREYEEALREYQRRDYRLGMVNVLIGLGRTYAARGELTEAFDRFEQAVSLIENVRANLSTYEARASFIATLTSAYEQQINLLMRRHAQTPQAGYENQAFQLSERLRARTLLELFAEARAELEHDVEPTLLTQLQAAQKALSQTAEQCLRLQNDTATTASQNTACREQLRQRTDDYEQWQARVRTASPRYAALAYPQPLTVEQTQRQLDEQTVLLEYALGEESSYVWLVTSQNVTSFKLPARREIETVARRFYELLTARQPRPGETALDRYRRVRESDAAYADVAAQLSQLVLGSLAAHLRQQRLVVVADGALNYVPFNTLPLPLEHPARQAGNLAVMKAMPLLAAHEVVNLPSASLLARQRDELGGRASAPKALAVFADPVFSTEDARLTATARLKPDQKLKPKTALQPKTPANELLAATPAVYTVSGSYSRGRLRDGSVLPRLLFSGREAQEIAALTAPSERLVATGFEARRETVFSSTLKDYRILHFATHALLDTEQPAVSGIVLSLYSQAGTPQPGFLQLHEIYGLHLAADLVVLSACQTALGREIKGEGLIGLTRGFIQSGAPRVVASLWSVDDAATRDLMKHFYVGMLKQGKRPAAALRASQLALWRQGRPPYYWAAFTFQGEWR